MTDESTGPANKLKPQCKGPYVVSSVQSDHMMIILKKLETNIHLAQPIHIYQLKMAYSREPTS